MPHGGWFPLAAALVIYVLMATWKRGRQLLREAQAEGSIPMVMCIGGLQSQPVVRVKGTAVFLTSDANGTPGVLLHHLKHNKVLHEHVVLLSVKTADVPEVSKRKRVTVTSLGNGFHRVVATFGFMQTQGIPAVMEQVKHAGVPCPPMDTTYFLGRERLIPTARPGEARPLARWRKVLFSIMSRNARSATDFFGLPPNRVVELGTQVEF